MNIKNLLHDLDAEARSTDTCMGLPIYDETEFERLVKVVEKHSKVSAKQLVTDLLGDLYGVNYVNNFLVAGSNWVRIETDHSVEYSVRRLVEHQLSKNGLCGSYWEMSEKLACVDWGLS